MRIPFLLLCLPLVACCKKTPPSGNTPGFGPTATLSSKTARPPAQTAAPTATATLAPTATATPPTAGKGKAQSPHLTMGVPTDNDPSDDYLMIKPQYALSYSKRLNDPNWVSWALDAKWFGDAPRFSGKFIADDSLPAGFYRVRHDDYTGSGYDRGHMVRSEERTDNDADNQSTFLTVNLLPQYHDLNAGPWLRLEEYCQKLAQREKKQLFIVAGGLFPPRPETIGKGVAVPTATFKIVVVLDAGQSIEHVTPTTRVIAVNMPNKTGIIREGWGQYRTTVAELEKATRYNFLPDLPPALQSALEGRKDTGPTD